MAGQHLTPGYALKFPMGYQFAALGLGPILYFQGRSVRASIPQLPEPPGARVGSKGSGERLRLLVIGDSSAAGVGAEHQNEALSGRLVDALSASFAVQWQLVAETGATTASTLRHVQKLEAGPFDIAVTSLGVNDVTSGVSRSVWIKQQAQLGQELRKRFGVAMLVVCGLPPVHGFPSLPQPLRWYLGSKASAFDRALEREVRTKAGVSYLSLRFTEDVSQMAVDGFHPGPQVYEEWGRRACVAIVDLVNSHR